MVADAATTAQTSVTLERLAETRFELGGSVRSERSGLRRDVVIPGRRKAKSRSMIRKTSINNIYSDTYAKVYRELYIDRWLEKHVVNLMLLNRLLSSTSQESCWLDVGCGQAWHFNKIDNRRARKIGVDISIAQLRIAQINNPNASFICADMADRLFRAGSIDLITSFWCPYTYLGSEENVTTFVNDLADMTAPGGSLYMDLMLPSGVATFAGSAFSRETGFAIEQLEPEGTRWVYRDIGGEHLIVTPELALFHDALSSKFRSVDVIYDPRLFAHLVAVDRLVAST